MFLKNRLFFSRRPYFNGLRPPGIDPPLLASSGDVRLIRLILPVSDSSFGLPEGPDEVETVLGAVSDRDLRRLPVVLLGVVVLKFDLVLTMFSEFV